MNKIEMKFVHRHRRAPRCESAAACMLLVLRDVNWLRNVFCGTSRLLVFDGSV